MANIYEEKTEALHAMLDRARSDDGATVLIPDLQRPYVWTPNQVSLLLDSLIRGWPFGTLLMWRVGQGDLPNIPHRPFWRVVDRTDEADGATVIRKDPPASFHMVLDGQQRVQSLLLALGGDAWGFKLEDRDWAQELHDRRPRGRQGRYRHWSKGSLCFDIDRFLTEYKTAGDVSKMEFQNTLQWAITDPAEGQSKWPKADKYEEPLPKASAKDNVGRFVRLSRLWNAATPNPSLKESQFREIVERLFKEEGIPAEKTAQALVPMGELMTTIRDVKLSKVTYLELLPFDKNVWSEDCYNDAIVSIFTRLNTAGRTLTREEITLAWLKVGWDSKQTHDVTAGVCFEQLLAALRDLGLTIEIDDLVGSVSFAWSACCNGGQVLENRDLLRGATIRPMATELSRRWEVIREAYVDGIQAVSERGLEYGGGGQFASLNAMSIAWCWLYLARQWEADQKFSTLQRDDFRKRCQSTLASMLDRWLICSQWAGLWAGSSQKVMAAHAKALHSDAKALAGSTTIAAAHQVLADRSTAMVTDLESEALAYVNTVSASSRAQVSMYRTLLWVWHRLNAERWEMSRVVLHTSKSAKPTLEVDHLVSYALWSAKVKGGLPTGLADPVDAEQLANMLGNCSLLEKTFNISKSSKPLSEFLALVHEFKLDTLKIIDWANALSVDRAILSPDKATTDAVVSAIKARDELIRAEAIEFVKGTKARVDV